MDLDVVINGIKYLRSELRIMCSLLSRYVKRRAVLAAPWFENSGPGWGYGRWVERKSDPRRRLRAFLRLFVV